MGQFYIDDSIHDEAGFIIGACVYTDIDINEKIVEIIRSCGFNPDSFEYKSSANYFKEPEKAKVRDQLKELLVNTCRLGIVVISRANREKLGFECIKAVKQFIDNNKKIKKPTSIYIDQGMFTSKDRAEQLINSINFTECTFYLEQNSINIKGIQLADLTAHIAAIQLKAALGLIKKKVPFKPYMNDDFETEIELEFELFSTIRYCFFNKGYTDYTGDYIKDAMIQVEPYGLFISDFCDDSLAKLARNIFGEIYLGSVD